MSEDEFHVSNEDKAWADKELRLLGAIGRVTRPISDAILTSAEVLGGCYLAAHDHWFGYVLLVPALATWVWRRVKD